MELKNVIVEREDKIAIVTINRSKALNTLNSETLKKLDNMIEELENHDDIYVVILTGAGEKAFVAWADISEMKDLTTMEGRKIS